MHRYETEIWPTYRYGEYGPDEEATIEDAIATSRTTGREVTIKWPGGASGGTLIYRLEQRKFDVEKVRQGWWRFTDKRDPSWSVLIQYSLDNPMHKGPLIGDPSGVRSNPRFEPNSFSTKKLKSRLMR